MKNFAASNRAKLLALSKEQRVDFVALLIRYSTDRLLYRLSQSNYQNSFVLKGSLLFSVWNDQMHRPTKDADLLGLGRNEASHVQRIFTEICAVKIPEDGMLFDIGSIKIEPIRDDEEYDGNRVRIKASLDGAEVTVQVDIGYGDVITPAAEVVELPAYLGMPSAKLLGYPQETVVSEKAEALVKLGIANSRMKDFYDLKWLAEHHAFDGEILRDAIVATFERRKTLLPREQPVGLSDEFYRDESKKRQWNSFARKLASTDSETFEKVGERVIQFLLPPLLNAREKNFDWKWTTDNGWSQT